MDFRLPPLFVFDEKSKQPRESVRKNDKKILEHPFGRDEKSGSLVMVLGTGILRWHLIFPQIVMVFILQISFEPLVFYQKLVIEFLMQHVQENILESLVPIPKAE
jgi:hypothetical protein